MTDSTPVIDASPLIHLARAGRTALLHELFGGVFVPEAVAVEVLRDPQDTTATQLTELSWLTRVAVPIPSELAAWDLGAGETATIAHALKSGCLAIVDDRAARRCCQALRIETIGTLGVVLRAAHEGYVEDPVRVLEEVRATGMWLTDNVFARVLELAREIQRGCR